MTGLVVRGPPGTAIQGGGGVSSSSNIFYIPRNQLYQIRDTRYSSSCFIAIISLFSQFHADFSALAILIPGVACGFVQRRSLLCCGRTDARGRAC